MTFWNGVVVGALAATLLVLGVELAIWMWLTREIDR